MFAIVNLKTGRVITPEGFHATSAVYFDVDDHEVFSHSQSSDAVFGLRKDSKLIGILGDLDEDESREGAFYFLLDHERLRLIHCTPLKKDCENLRR